MSRKEINFFLLIIFLFIQLMCFFHLHVLHVLICLNAQLKERAEKLENWKMKEKMREEKKKEKNELLRRQSSLWINEPELEKKILEAIVDTTPL